MLKHWWMIKDRRNLEGDKVRMILRTHHIENVSSSQSRLRLAIRLTSLHRSIVSLKARLISCNHRWFRLTKRLFQLIPESSSSFKAWATAFPRFPKAQRILNKARKELMTNLVIKNYCQLIVKILNTSWKFRENLNLKIKMLKMMTTLSILEELPANANRQRRSLQWWRRLRRQAERMRMPPAFNKT